MNLGRLAPAVLERTGHGVGRVAGVAAAAVRVPTTLLARDGVADPDVGRLGPLPFDGARRLPAPDGGDLFTVSHGTGPTFVFVHGLLLTSRIWTKQFRDLPAAGLRAVAFDHRGHGASTAPPVGATGALADDVVAVFDGLDLRDVVLVAHSTAAAAACAAVASGRLAGRVRGLVLVGPTSRPLPMVLPGSVVRPFVRGFVGSGAWSRFEWSRLAARACFGPDPRPSQVELVRALLASATPAVVAAAVDAAFTADLSGVAPDVAVPTLVVNGSADLLSTPGEARQLARRLPDGRIEVVPGAGHLVMLERADAFATLCRGFATDVGAVTGRVA